ncbi:MAG: laccase domain-containing protein, partial [Frankiales bacterium]|nr:laccase domain-containing protein [Frankiales bacterium]
MLLPAGLPAAVRAGFSTRTGGVSVAPYAGLNLALHVGDAPADVAANRSRLGHALDVEHLIFAEQVHGPGVAVVEGPHPTMVTGVDALVTRRPGLALVVLAADCLPDLLVDPAA